MWNSTIVGHLGRDPETIDTKTGTVVKFSVAVRGGRKEDPASWVNCAIFGRESGKGLGGIATSYLRKGSLVSCGGRTAIRTYTDREGQERTVVDLVVDQLTLCGGKGEGERGASAGDGPRGVSDLDDDIPF